MSLINKRKNVFLLVAICFVSFSVFPQKNIPAPTYQIVETNDFVLSKNYYLLSLFQSIPDVKKFLSFDEVFTKIATNKSNFLFAALKDCGRDGACFTDKMKFTAAEINMVSERLAALYKPTNALGKLVQEHLIPSGTYILFQNLSAKEMLVKAWQQDAEGVNYCISVYADGKKPNYPLIDSISFKTRDALNNTIYALNYVGLLYNTTSLVALESKTNNTFFYTPLTFALRFLEMNEREQAGDYEPMAKGENQLAVEHIKTIKWTSYAYSIILVPGAGPDEPNETLSAEGKLRCRLAAIQYYKGVAPFIVTSGGKVHPYKTPYCEATEMKNYLINKLNIPANAILIEPHARHTTTNMRNAVRIIYRYGIPFDKPAITCTTKYQSTIISNTLADRCMRELNEIPFKIGNRLSETEIEFFPLKEALHINPKEPMDP